MNMPIIWVFCRMLQKSCFSRRLRYTLSPLLHLTRSNYFPGPGTRELEETSVSRSIIYQAGETANLPCDISLPNKQNDELMLIMWYREDVRSPIYSIGKLPKVFFLFSTSRLNWALGSIQWTNTFGPKTLKYIIKIIKKSHFAKSSCLHKAIYQLG